MKEKIFWDVKIERELHFVHCVLYSPISDTMTEIISFFPSFVTPHYHSMVGKTFKAERQSRDENNRVCFCQ